MPISRSLVRVPIATGAPIELDLGGRGIREIRKNASNQYVMIAGPAGDATGTAPADFRLYTWTGNAVDVPVLRSTDLTALNAGGSFESIVEVPTSLSDTSTLQLLVDNGETVFYNDGAIAKDVAANFQKSRSELVTLGSTPTVIPITKINTIQGTGTAATAGTFTIEGIVVGDFQALGSSAAFISKKKTPMPIAIRIHLRGFLSIPSRRLMSATKCESRVPLPKMPRHPPIKDLKADVVGLIEMENDGDGANSAIVNLVNGLNAAIGSNTYDYIKLANTTGSPGTDEIKVAFIYKPGAVTPVGNAVYFNDFAFNTARPPLAQTFINNASGEKFTPSVNHFKSKGSSAGLSIPIVRPRSSLSWIGSQADWR